jgi:transposase
MDAGYRDIHLANPCAIKQYEGLKYTDDRHDAFWLAHLLALDILPEGYIYPKEDRPVRDLLRKRSFLVRQRTMHIHSLRTMIERSTSRRFSSREIYKLEASDLKEIFDDKHLILSARASVASICFLTHHIERIQKAVKKRVKIRESFKYLRTVPGIGEVLALTIMLEVWAISVDSQRWAISPLMPGAYPRRGYRMERARAKGSARTAIGT